MNSAEDPTLTLSLKQVIAIQMDTHLYSIIFGQVHKMAVIVLMLMRQHYHRDN
jgi:hypothetical protein